MMLFEVKDRSLVLLSHHLSLVFLLINIELIFTEHILAEVFWKVISSSDLDNKVNSLTNYRLIYCTNDNYLDPSVIQVKDPPICLGLHSDLLV
jgi:hypothetical protein